MGKLSFDSVTICILFNLLSFLVKKSTIVVFMVIRSLFLCMYMFFSCVFFFVSNHYQLSNQLRIFTWINNTVLSKIKFILILLTSQYNWVFNNSKKTTHTNFTINEFIKARNKSSKVFFFSALHNLCVDF